MKKYEIIFKKTERSRKSFRWERFAKGITPIFISHLIWKIKDVFGLLNNINPVILKIQEIPYIKGGKG